AAADNVALIQQILPGQCTAQPGGTVANLGGETRAQRFLSPVPGRISKTLEDVQTFVIEEIGVGIVVTLSGGVCLCHSHQLEEAGTIRIALDATGVTALPKPLQHLAATDEAKVAQVAIAVVVIQYPVPGLNAASSRDPHRRMGFLQGARPDIHIAQLRILTVKTKGLRTSPGLDDEVVAFAVLVTQGCGHFSVGKVGIHGGPNRESSDKTPTGHDIEHGKLFCDADWRIIQGNAVPQDRNDGALRAPAQSSSHKVGRWHEAVGILVMFIHAESIKT